MYMAMNFAMIKAIQVF